MEVETSTYAALVDSGIFKSLDAKLGAALSDIFTEDLEHWVGVFLRAGRN